jgi:hypothetical protein
MRLTLALLLVLALIAGAACTQVAETPPETTLPPTTPVTQAPTTTPPPATTAPAEETTPPATEEAITEADIETARQVVFAYFDALNSYDLEGALACMEESWGNEQEPGLASEINQMKTYGVTLNVEEEAEATVTADGRIELPIKIDVSMAFQPDRHAIYQLTKIEGEWKICYSEES